MTKEDKILQDKFGKQNPFKVPEGYFEQFSENIMKQLPEKTFQDAPQITTWQRFKPWVYMAAMFCGLMLSVRMFVGENPRSPEQIPSATSEYSLSSEEYIAPIINQTMMDDYTLYQYLTEADTEIYQ